MPQTQTKSSAPAVSHKDMANAIRALAMDAVEKAASGHPGMPMGMADVATVLFTQFLKIDPKHPSWPDRDRFVLSAGHGSMLQYALHYLMGYEDMSLDDIKNFRQFGAKTAGHPEFGHAEGIETTTGPLGQGIANAVGFALAERMQAARYPAFTDHYTYVIAGDGCLMEGISQEALSLAGHLKLSKLIVLWDDNKISIDGPTSLTISEDTLARFAASGWATDSVDGHNEAEISRAIAKAQKSDKPTIISCRTTIGFGAPTKAGTSGCHGSPLGKSEIEGAREKLGWPHAAFEIPEGILAAWRDAGARGKADFDAWTKKYDAADASVRGEFERTVAGELPASWVDAFNAFKQKLAESKPTEATRKSSENVLQVLTESIPELIGGSADLTGSNNTKASCQLPVASGQFSGRYIYYGVREHAMGAVMNGLALHGGFIPYGGTFLVFADYCRPAIRLSALMGQRVVYVMTHDSIGLGEDGPTHQPVEHLASLRAIPNLYVFRPADAMETAECWALSLAQQNAPSLLSLSRQNLPALRTEYTADNLCARGGYVLSSGADIAGVTLIATGSEVSLAVEAQKKLAEKGISAQVVSLPCWELFDAQPASYREEVLGKNTLKVAIEAAASFGWERYIGTDGIFIGMSGFGASAPAPELYKHFGITVENIVESVERRIK
ncbi:MAG: transketolase [Alphaproteobacteria bacterium]|nr:transketolase [Alphaproteobacteria bacterium]